MPQPPSQSEIEPAIRATRAGWTRLLLAVVLIVVLWGGVFPWVAGWSGIESFIARNHELEIDPAAMFYSELPAMENARNRVRSAQRTSPRAWWGIAETLPHEESRSAQPSSVP